MKIRVFRLLFSFLLIGFLFVACGISEAGAQDNNSQSVTLEQIVITGSRIKQKYRDSTQNISVVIENNIDSQGANEISEVLDLLPGVDVLEYGPLGSVRSVHLRGAASNQHLVLIDGRPVNTARDGAVDFNQISLSNIERIEVLRGPASNIYGASAVGGVINIITKDGSGGPETTITNKLGSFATKFSSLTHANKLKDFDYFLSYDYAASHGHRNNSDYLSHNINTKFGYQINDNHKITVSSGYYNSEVGTPGLISNVDLDDQQETFKKYVDITYNGKAFEGQDTLIKLFYNFDRLEFIETINPMDKDTQQTKVYGLDSQLSQVFFDRLRTTIGFSYQEHRLNSSTSSKHTYNLKGVYAEAEADFDNFLLKSGIRWDDYSNFEDKFSPSLSFNYWLFDDVKIHGLVARSFRAPTFNDLYWPSEDWGAWGGVEGNPSLGPENALSYEGGIGGYYWEKNKFEVTFFRTKYKNLIEWSVDDALWWRPNNVSSALTRGVEFDTELVLNEYFKTNFNYTYLDATNRDTKKWLIYRPRHLYKLNLVYSPNDKFQANLSGIYKTKRFANASNTTFLKHYLVINLASTYKLKENIAILFEIKNILDREYQEQRLYPLPGRAFYGGLKLSF